MSARSARPAPPPPAAGPLRVLRYAEAAPLRNMALDAALLAAAPVATLRLYGWAPHAVSLGYFQDAADAAEAVRLGLPVVRRMTGGGAIVHAREVTYSLVLPTTHPVLHGLDVKASYAALHAPIRDALAAFGVDTEVRAVPVGGAAEREFLCFARATELDLVAGGRKIVGSAQRRVPGRVLQHGSILLEDHPAQPGTASVAAISGRRPAPALFAAALERAFVARFGPAATGTLSPEEESLAEDVDAFRADRSPPRRAS